MDELMNIPWDPHSSYNDWLYLMPQVFYNDRPLGRITELFLYRTFGFDYSKAVIAFLLLHFANCVLAYLLFRQLNVSRPICLGCIALFASLSTTVQTATYLGASFDVLCTFFILSSALASLGRKWFHPWLSASLYILALRCKEFSIVLPLILTLLLVWQEGLRQKDAGGSRIISSLHSVWRRLWPHYVILAVFGGWYLHLAVTNPIPANNPYHLDFRLQTIVGSLVYYIALVFQRDESRRMWLPAAIFALIGILALVRRNPRILFAFLAFLLLILPTAALPNMRAIFYAYCPQIFLILIIGLVLDDVVNFCIRAADIRNWTVLAVATGVLCCSLAFQSGSYFRARVAWIRNVRYVSARTARSIQAQLGAAGPAAHLYFSSGSETPSLLLPGPCHYLHLVRHDDSLSCVIQRPDVELNALYDQDHSEKYLVDYFADGSVSVRDHSYGRK